MNNLLDKFRETAITWDKATRRIYSPISANESDSNGRKLNIQVVNSGQVENLTGATLHLYWETKDKAQHGLDAFTASDISKGEFEIFYTTGMLSNVGELNATLVLVDATGQVVSDWFKITVARGIDNDAIQSENSFTSLTQALIDIGNLEQNYTPRLNDLTAQLQQLTNEGVIDLILFAGQSNMAGRGTASESIILEEGEGFEFRSISDPTKLYKATEPFGVNENKTGGLSETSKTGGMVTAIMKSYYEATKIPMVGVSASQGGTSINQWQPNGAFLNDVVARFTTALNWLESNGYTVRNKFIIWCQGETDGDNLMTKSDYQAKFKTMINYLNSTLGTSKCFIVRIGNQRDNPSLYDPIIEAQTDLAREYEPAVLVSTKFAEMAKRGLMKDLFHYKQAAYNEVGLDAGKNMAFYANNLIKPYMFDKEYESIFFPYFMRTNFLEKPIYRTVFTFDAPGENALEVNSVGTYSGGKITIIESNKGKKQLDVPFVISPNKEWTIEVIASSPITASSDSSGIILSQGVDTGGFLNIPNGRSSNNIFQFRDTNRKVNVRADIPQSKFNTEVHQYAITYSNNQFRMYMDYIEYPVILEGTMPFVEFNMNNMFGGFNEASKLYNFKGDCLYLAFTDNRQLLANEMHVE